MKCTKVHYNSEESNPLQPCTDIVRGLLFAGATKEGMAYCATPDAFPSVPMNTRSSGWPGRYADSFFFSAIDYRRLHPYHMAITYQSPRDGLVLKDASLKASGFER